MFAALALALAAAIAAIASAQLELSIVLLESEVDRGVKCLDGSPVAYYLRRNESNNNWVMYFEGGGWCYNVEDCYQRSLTTLGSSTTYPQVLASTGILSNSSNDNPDFFEWNAVYMPYCDGGSWTGGNMTIVQYQGHDLFFRGKINLNAVLASLSQAGMNNAENILITGCSAGGLSTYQHSDFIAQSFPSAVVKAAPVSGFFLPIDNVQNVDVYTQELTSVYFMMNSSSGVHQGCVAANPTNPSTCIFAPNVYPHIVVPVFVLNSMYDSWQLQCIVTANSENGNCNSNTSWSSCMNGPQHCDPQQITYLNENFRDVMLSALTTTNKWNNTANGALLDSCMSHCELMTVPGPGGYSVVGDWSTGIIVDGVDAVTAVGNWYFERSSSNIYIDCAYTTTSPIACNPTCGQGVSRK